MVGTRRGSCVALTAAFMAGAAAFGASAQGGGGATPPPGAATALGRSMECHYSLAARVRPLLFWVGKDNVGEGRIAWLAGENGEQGFELLIGSLPDRAPRKINRWGYISERKERSQVHVIGFMTEVDAETYEQAEATTGGIPADSRVYKVIQGNVGEASAASRVSGIALSDKLTLRDLDVVAAQVPAPDLSARIAVPPGAHPGFLFAMASLLRENVESYRRTAVPPVQTVRTFVYGNKIYRATTRSSRFLARTTIRGRVFTNVIESEFDARQAGKGSGSRYRLVYGTEGELREVPVRIVYRPKWWFEAELVMLSGVAPAELATGRRGPNQVFP